MGERPVLWDLFCCAGGAARGYELAGFRVLGVDREPQPRYPYPFVRADALAVLRALVRDPVLRAMVRAVHASPPCQAWSDLQKQSKLEYEDFIAETRELLELLDCPWVIENVEGAPLREPVQLCGANDDVFPELRVIRHRRFESNVPLVGVPCPERHPLVFTHDRRKAHHGKLDPATSYVQVTGGGNAPVSEKARAMGIDWMIGRELNEAIPPAYTEFIGRQLMGAIT